MSPPTIDSAIIAAMQATPAATQLVIRKKVGATEHHFSEAVKRLRWAGKLHWERFELAPSLQVKKIPPTADPLPTKAVKAKEGAGNARRGKRAVPDRSTPECPLPGPSTIADEVKAECQVKGERRTMARKISATAMDPLPAPPTESIADRFRRLAREVDEEELAAQAEIEAQERRERDLDRLGSPSAVLRLAQRDWPTQCRDVAAIAAELGIGLGECWRRVIKAGVDCLRDCDGEAAA